MPIKDLEKKKIGSILKKKIEFAKVPELIQILFHYQMFVPRAENFENIVLHIMLSRRKEMINLLYYSDDIWEQFPENYYPVIVNEINDINLKFLKLLENQDSEGRDILPFTYIKDNTSLSLPEYLNLLKRMDHNNFKELFYQILLLPYHTHAIRASIVDFQAIIMDDKEYDLIELICFLHESTDHAIVNFSTSISGREIESISIFYNRLISVCNKEGLILKLNEISTRFIENVDKYSIDYLEPEYYYPTLISFKLDVLMKNIDIKTGRGKIVNESMLFDIAKLLEYTNKIRYDNNLATKFFALFNSISDFLVEKDKNQDTEKLNDEFYSLLLKLLSQDVKCHWIINNDPERWFSLFSKNTQRTCNEEKIFDSLSEDESLLNKRFLMKIAFQVDSKRTKEQLFSDIENTKYDSHLSYIDTSDFVHFSSEELSELKKFILENIITIIEGEKLDLHAIGFYSGLEILNLNKDERFSMIENLKDTPHISLMDYFFMDTYQDFLLFTELLKDKYFILRSFGGLQNEKSGIYVPNQILNHLSKEEKSLDKLEEMIFNEKDSVVFENLLRLYYEPLNRVVHSDFTRLKNLNITLLFNLLIEKDISFHSILFQFLNKLMYKPMASIELNKILKISENFDKFLGIISLHVDEGDIDVSDLLRLMLFKSRIVSEEDLKTSPLNKDQIKKLFLKCREIIMNITDFQNPVRYKFLNFSLDRMYHYKFPADTPFIMRIEDIRNNFESIVNSLQIVDVEEDSTFRIGGTIIDTMNEKGILKTAYDYLSLVNPLALIDNLLENLISHLHHLPRTIQSPFGEIFRSYEHDFLEQTDYQPILTDIIQSNSLFDLQFNWLVSKYIHNVHQRNQPNKEKVELGETIYSKIFSIVSKSDDLARVLMCDFLKEILRYIKHGHFTFLCKLVLESEIQYPLSQITLMLWQYHEFFELIIQNKESLYKNEWGIKLLKRIYTQFGSIDMLKHRLESRTIPRFRN